MHSVVGLESLLAYDEQREIDFLTLIDSIGDVGGSMPERVKRG